MVSQSERPSQAAVQQANEQRALAAEQARRREAERAKPAPAETAPDIAPAPAKKQSLSYWLQTAAVAVGFAAGLLLAPFSDRPSDPGQSANAAMVAATLAFQPAPTLTMPASSGAWPTCTISAASSAIDDLDVVLVIDTTGSMGPLINDVKTNARALIANLQARGGSTRVGVVAYRDQGDRYVTRQLPLTGLADGAPAVTEFINGLAAEGGGDWPEAIDDALASAIGMAWRPDAAASIIVIGDAPAHPGKSKRALDLATSFAARANAQVSVIDAGSGPAPFMRQLPDFGNGQYVTYNGNILRSLFPAITGCPST